MTCKSLLIIPNTFLYLVIETTRNKPNTLCAIFSDEEAAPEDGMFPDAVQRLFMSSLGLYPEV